MKKFILIGLSIAFCLPAALGVVLLNDDFSYADGSLITNSAFFWNAHSGTTGQTQVVSGKLQLSFSQSEDVSALLAGQPYPASGTTNVFYAGFTVRFTALPSASGSYFAHFKDATATGDFRARIWAFTGGAAAGKFRLGISSTSGSVISATNTTELATNTDYRVVTRLVNTNSVATLWIDPVLESDPSVSTTEAAQTATVATYAFRQASGIGAMLIDDLVVGTRFDEVVSGQPMPPTILEQPTSQSVTQGANVTFSVAASGSIPLFYQWFFENGPVAGGTNASLTLSNVSVAAAGDYWVVITNRYGATNSDPATLIVNPPPAPPVPGFSLLTYNVAGFGATNWSTNAPQVRAIARQVQYLNPDIITFQEIPYDLSYEMTNFVKAFLPGYALARNSGTDGAIRSVIVSRFPITRSQSHLANIDLRSFGYSNANNSLDNFTRDLFEAEIAVSGFPQPLHVFTTHLKATSGMTYTEAAAKRAAEAAAITNFLATNILALYPLRPYVLTGDLNDSDTNALAIQKLISTPTGLRLTNPTNPFTGSINTYSIRSTLNSRLDYIMPNGLLLANVAGAQVFRSDLLPDPPPPLLAEDSAAASDHLPVMMIFNNPYDKPFRLTSIARSNASVTLQWESVPGQPYRVLSSSNLTNWSLFATNMTATGASFTFTTNTTGEMKFFRVYRVP